jgi:serine/threonine-protein kinase HipA
MHSLSGLINADHRTPSLEYDGFLKATLMLTRDVREVEQAFSIACFNVLGHNCDDHTKNFSFLMDAQGKWVLAPAYDLTFSYGPGGWQSMMVMGEGKAPGLADLRKLATKHGIAAADSVITRVQQAIARWPLHAEVAGVTKTSANMIERGMRMIAARDAPKPTTKSKTQIRNPLRKPADKPPKKSLASPKAGTAEPKLKRT